MKDLLELCKIIQTHKTWIMLYIFIECLTASKAYAFVQGGLSYGFGQKATIDASHEVLKDLAKKKIPVTTYKLSLLFSLPLPTEYLSVGLGLNGGMEIFDLQNHPYTFIGSAEEKDRDGTLQRIRSLYAGPEMFLGITIPGVPLTPYGRLSYVFSTQDLTAKLPALSGSEEPSYVSIPLAGRGLRYSAGIEISPLPIVSIFVEHEWAKDNIGLSDALKLVEKVAEKSSEDTKEMLYKVTDNVNVKNFDFSIARQGFLVGIKLGF